MLEVGGGSAASASLLRARLLRDRSSDRRRPFRRGPLRRSGARREHLDAGTLRVLECDVTALELPEASIDRRSLNVNVSDVPRLQGADVLARVLRPGGLLALLWSGAPTASDSATARVLATGVGRGTAGPFTDVTIHDTPSGCGVIARRS